MKLGEYDCKFCEKIYTSNQNLGKHIQLCIFFKKSDLGPPPMLTLGWRCLKHVSEAHKMMLAASSPFEASRIYQGMRVLKMYQLGRGMSPRHNLVKPVISLATYYTSR